MAHINDTLVLDLVAAEFAREDWDGADMLDRIHALVSEVRPIKAHPKPLLEDGPDGEAIYVGPLAAGIALYLMDFGLNEGAIGINEIGNWVIDTEYHWSVAPTLGEAWRLLLGAYLGPIDEGYDEGALRRALERTGLTNEGA